MRPAPDAWTHLTADSMARYMAFASAALPDLARVPLPWWRRLRGKRGHAVLKAALREARDMPGVGLEFGVYKGRSLRLSAARHPRRRFHGFDSFTGLPDDGRPDWQLDFATRALPRVPANCTLHPGWFADTIPAWRAAHPEMVGFLNIDSDLYSSAREALFGVADRLQPGTTIYFDELLNYDTFLWNELLALYEFLEATGYGIRWIAAPPCVRSVETALGLLADGRYPEWRADVKAGFGRPAALVLTAPGSAQLPAPDAHAWRQAETFETLTRRLRAGHLVASSCAPEAR